MSNENKKTNHEGIVSELFELFEQLESIGRTEEAKEGRRRLFSKLLMDSDTIPRLVDEPIRRFKFKTPK